MGKAGPDLDCAATEDVVVDMNCSDIVEKAGHCRAGNQIGGNSENRILVYSIFQRSKKIQEMDFFLKSLTP